MTKRKSQQLNQLGDRSNYQYLSDYENPNKSKEEEIGEERKQKKDKKSQVVVDLKDEVRSFGSPRKRRSRIPNRPGTSLNLWSIIKSSVGKDLSKIPMPVTFNEPLSMLQRLAENLEYSILLDEVVKKSDPGERLAYLAAYTVSCYSTTANRTSKPFNPILGETYEWDRHSDLGWKLISEQVSHHPPISVQFCTGSGWTFCQDFGIQSKFRGQYMRIVTLGSARLDLRNGSHYHWSRVNTSVNNIIMGKLWIDNDGECTIEDMTTGWKCNLIYFPFSFHNKDKQRRVSGTITNENGAAVWSVDGKWDSHMTATLINSGQPPRLIWQCNPPLADSDKFYNFTLFACQLNEPEKGVAPTDSRRRPDQRLMEKGYFDEADKVKGMLENKQRSARKEREEKGKTYEPVWFTKAKNSRTGESTYIYKGDYWGAKLSKNWSACPDIFSLTSEPSDGKQHN